MQDLDIRGMGNMLGAEQSGFIADMGFETYQRILAEAFEEIKQDYSKENPDETPQEDLENQCYVNDCAVETDLQLLIPDTYINIQAEKIRLYRELDNISDEEELGRFISSLEDRFGPIPDEVRELCFVVRLRWLAKAKGFEKIVLKNEKLLAYFVGNQMSPYYRTRKFADIINYIQQKPGDRYAFKEQNSKLYLTVNRVRTIEGAYKVMSSL
jgi:transcription-repair coupling factor (superfamily II helicase)